MVGVAGLELEVTGFEDGSAEDEAGLAGPVVPPCVVLSLVVVSVVVKPVLQAMVVARDVISAPTAAVPVRFKNCRLENNDTRKIFRFSSVSCPSFSGMLNHLKLVPS